MKLTLLHKIFEFTAITKAVAYKKGTLVLLSTPLSIGFIEAFKTLFKNVTMYDLVLPIISIITCIILYSLFWFVDFLTGLSASKYEQKNNPDWVQSDKLYSSFGKIGSVLLLDVLFLVILLFLTVVQFQKIALGFLIISVAINMLAILFEFQSIGENIKRKTGKKPKYFTFFDRLTNLLENLILNKFKRWFGEKTTFDSSNAENIEVNEPQVVKTTQEIEKLEK